MEYGPLQFFTGALVACAILVWVRHRRFHESALGHVRQFCAANQLQLLDATVAFRGYRLERRPFHLCRSYRFDYSRAGTDRHSGLFTLCADQVQSFRIAPEHLIDNAVSSPVDVKQIN